MECHDRATQSGKLIKSDCLRGHLSRDRGVIYVERT